MLDTKKWTGVDAQSHHQNSLSPYFMLRAAGMPVQCLLEMRAVQTMESLVERFAFKRSLAELTSQLVEMIEKHVPLVTSDELRNRLITYKRDIFNGRKPRVNQKIFADVVPEAILIRMAAWESTFEQIEQLYSLAKGQFEQELVQSRIALQTAIAQKNYLQGMALSSQDLFPKILKYIETPIQKQDARLRKTEYSLMSFLSRVVVKTSPFSSFTSVGIGFWKEDGEGFLDIDNLNSTSHIQINYANLLRIVDALVQHPEIRKLVHFKINPSLVLNDGKFRLLRRTDHSLARARVHRTIENSITFDASQAIQGALRIFQDEQVRSMPYHTLVEKMSGKTGLAEASVSQFVDKLIDLQVLEADLPLYQQAPDLLDSVLQWLDSFSVPVAKQTSDRLQQIKHLLQLFSTVPFRERGEILRQLRQIIEDICVLLDRSIADASLKLLLYEDEILTNVSAAPMPKWDRLIEDLAAYQSISPLFDVKFRLQSEIADQFKAMYGEDGVCNNSSEFLSEFSKIFMKFNRALLPTEILADLDLETSNPHIQQLNVLKREFGKTLAKRMLTEDEVVFTREEMADFSLRIPEPIQKRPISHDLFVQVGKNSEQMVINQMFVGYSTFLSRFLKYFEQTDVVQAVGKQLQELFPAGEVVAEQASVFGFNANLHPALTPYDLDVPTLGASRSDSDSLVKINWNEISFVYDKQLDRVALVHPEFGRVNVLYAATLTPRLLPYLVGAIVTLFTNGAVSNNLFLFAEAELSKEQREEPRVYPRVRVGDVVISRKKWVLPRERVIMRTEKESDFEYFFRLQQWREELGLPQRGFFRFLPADDSENPWLQIGGVIPTELEKTPDLTDYKPQFVDFENPLLVKLFGKRLNNVPMGIVVEEMFPDVEDLVLENEQGSYVTEFLIELNRVTTEGI